MTINLTGLVFACIVVFLMIGFMGWIGGVSFGSIRWGIIGAIIGAVISISLKLFSWLVSGNVFVETFHADLGLVFIRIFFALLKGAALGAILGPLARAIIKTIKDMQKKD